MEIIRNDFLKKAERQMDYGNIINLPLSLPETCVLVVAPKSCIRIFYFQALKKKSNDKLYMLPVSEVQLISGEHLNMYKEAVEEIFKEKNPKNLVVVIMCPDVILGSNFESLTTSLEKKHGKNLRLFKRGPLVNSKISSKERMMNIIDELLEKNV